MMLPSPLRRTRSRFQEERERAGLAPGTLVAEADAPPGPVRVELFDYDAERFEERDLDDVAVLARYRDRGTVTWVNVEGVQDVALVERIGHLFDVHPLTLEDIVNTDQRPKLEEYDHYSYVVLHMMHYDHDACALETEQVSIVFGEGFLLSFQEAKEGDVFDPVRDRLREGRGRIRGAGADFLAYALVDLIVDFYMAILEGLGEHIERVEDEITLDADPAMSKEINRLRRNAHLLRRTVWPLRDVVLALERSQQPFMAEETDVFLRDVYDHTVRTVELIETSRELLASNNELYLSMLSFKMNEVMKVLTIIATFFLPLTFVTGLYGMNFDPSASPLNMPELDWYFGYPFALTLMATMAAGMWYFFRRKGWL